jgi:DNA-binding CsgD family transcriptional regulator
MVEYAQAAPISRAIYSCKKTTFGNYFPFCRFATLCDTFRWMKSAMAQLGSPNIVKSLTLSELAQTDASALLATLYSAVGNDAAWHGVMRSFCQAFDAHTGMLVVAGQGQRDQSFYAAHNHAESVARAYSEQWWQHDLWLHGALAQGLFRAGWIGRGSDWVSPEALRESAFYKDFLLTMPAEHLLCAVLSDGSGALRAPPMHLSLFRRPDQSDFSPQDAQNLAAIYPHLHRAFDLHWQMKGAQEQLGVFHRSLDSMDFGVSFFDTAGQLSFANIATKQIALRADSFWAKSYFLSEKTTPAPAAPHARDALGALLLSAATGEGGSSLLEGETMALALPVSAPAKNGAGDARAAVMLLLIERQSRADSAVGFVIQAFGLSPAESRVLPLLVQGKTPTEIAQSLDLKLPTVRSQLSAIFAKTGTTRQQELIRLLGAVPPLSPMQPGA